LSEKGFYGIIVLYGKERPTRAHDPRLFGVQTPELYFRAQQNKHAGKNRLKQILPSLQKAHVA